MLPPDVLDELARAGLEVDARRSRRSSGEASRAVRIDTARGPALVKLEPRAESDRLETEAESLAAIGRTNAIAVPAVLAQGTAGKSAYLAIEWIAFGPRSAQAERRLGAALATMHAATADAFGWPRDNYIGRTPQPNGWNEDWIELFRERRLAYQLELAARNSLGGDALALGERLLGRLETFFDGHAPRPSLLHGDLWGGNWGATADGTPYVFDPAAYYGDAEADLAMTRLFGGFGGAFYRAYDEARPPAPGRDERVTLYNLYHLLNHFNLFGAGYSGQVLASLRALTSR